MTGHLWVYNLLEYVSVQIEETPGNLLPHNPSIPFRATVIQVRKCTEISQGYELSKCERLNSMITFLEHIPAVNTLR